MPKIGGKVPTRRPKQHQWQERHVRAKRRTYTGFKWYELKPTWRNWSSICCHNPPNCSPQRDTPKIRNLMTKTKISRMWNCKRHIYRRHSSCRGSPFEGSRLWGSPWTCNMSCQCSNLPWSFTNLPVYFFRQKADMPTPKHRRQLST